MTDVPARRFLVDLVADELGLAPADVAVHASLIDGLLLDSLAVMVMVIRVEEVTSCRWEGIERLDLRHETLVSLIDHCQAAIPPGAWDPSPPSAVG